MSTSVLTFAPRSLILISPNQVSRNRRLLALPKSGEVLSAHSAIFRVPSSVVSAGRRVSIGRPATSSIREDWRLHLSRGALSVCLFLLNPPKSSEVPMSEFCPSHGDTAHPDSLPRCLCHSSQFEVLEEARALAFYLQYVARLPQREEDPSEAVKLGSDLCFDLLLDKIEIAMGVYRFPYSGSFDAPTLCIREG